MPVDYTPCVLAGIAWIAITRFAWRRIRASSQARWARDEDRPMPRVVPIFWTMWASIATAIVLAVLTALVEHLTLTILR